MVSICKNNYDVRNCSIIHELWKSEIGLRLRKITSILDDHFGFMLEKLTIGSLR